jgi:hypothetical protein
MTTFAKHSAIRISAALLPIFMIPTLLGASVRILNLDPMTQVVNGVPGPGQYSGFNETHGNGMVGWTFTLQQSVTVTRVAWYDEDQNGLSHQFEVGLWHGSNQLLGDQESGLFIPAGTAAALDGRWRVVDLPNPVELQPGDYVLGGLDSSTSTDVIKYAHLLPTDVSDPALTGSRLTVGEFFYASIPQPQTGFDQPSNFALLTGLELGPMLYINVPEPQIRATAYVLAATCMTIRGGRGRFSRLIFAAG